MTNYEELIKLGRTKYATNWQHEWEQAQARVVPYTTMMPDALNTGKYYQFPVIGGTEVHEYTGVNVDIVLEEPTTKLRGMKYRKFHNELSFSIDQVRDMDTLDMTLSMLMTKQRAAAERFFDMTALGVKREGGIYKPKTRDDAGYAGGILSTGYGGENGETEYELDLSLAGYQAGTGNLIPVDYATQGTGANYIGTLYDRLDAMKTRLMETDAFNGNPEDLVLCISPKVQQMLRGLELSLNRDYGVGEMRLGVASYNSKMQATVLVSNMLPTMNTETLGGQTISGARMCCAWLKSQIGFGAHHSEYHIKDINTKVDVDNYTRVRGRAACARMRDDAVMVLPVDESPAA